MKSLNLDILAVDGLMLRAYLSALDALGYTPHRIYHVVPEGGNGALLSVLPFFLRVGFAKMKRNLTSTSWVRELTFKYSGIWKDLVQVAGAAAGLPPVVIDNLKKDIPGVRSLFSRFSCPKVTIIADNLKDPRCLEYFAANSPRALLSTSDELAPRSLLELHGFRLLLFHPGVLPVIQTSPDAEPLCRTAEEPYIRGSDGLLWSALLRGKAGLSGIYLAPGLDEGDVFYCREFPLPKLPQLAKISPVDQYYLIRAFVAPLFRVKGLIDTIISTPDKADFSCLPAFPQDLEKGVTYTLMSPRLRERALPLFYSQNNNQ